MVYIGRANILKLAQEPTKPFLFVLCGLSLYAHSLLKMASKQRFPVNEILSQLFDIESDKGECV